MEAVSPFLARVAGAKTIGLNGVRVAPGKLPTPPHSHGASEEVYYVLGGSGLLWQDGQVHEVRPRDCVIQLADHFEHTFVAGAEGLDYLVFGTRHATEIGWLPRSRAIRLGWPWVEGRDDDPWDVEAEQPPLEFGAPSPRPANIANLDNLEVDPDGIEGETAKVLAGACGSVQAGLNWARVAPGLAPTPA